MAIADSKKAQTIRNLWHLKVAKPIAEADQVTAAIRAAITENSLNTHFSSPELSAMLAVETDLAALAASAGIAQAESMYRLNHSTEPATVGLEV